MENFALLSSSFLNLAVTQLSVYVLHPSSVASMEIIPARETVCASNLISDGIQICMAYMNTHLWQEKLCGGRSCVRLEH